MSRNLGISAGLAVGILIGLVIAILLVRMANTNKKYKTEYDERQLRVRGDAYRYAFYTIVIYEAILAILAVGEITLPIQGYLLHFAGILLGCLVLSGYSIWKDAWWGINNNRKRYAIIFIVCAVLNLIPVVGAISTGSLMEGGHLTSPFLNLMVCFMLLVVGIELLIKSMMEKNSDKEEE